MKIKTLFVLLFIIIFGITNQLVFGMELTPARTITIKEVFSVKSIAFDQKERDMVHLLLSHQGNKYLTSYNSQTTQLTQYNDPIKKKSRKLKLFMQNNADRLPKTLGSYSLSYKNNAVEIWSTATKEHLYTLSHSSPIARVMINNSKTQIITASVGNKINIWQLKKPIIFSCGQDQIAIDNTKENFDVLRQSEAIKNMFDALDGADLHSEIPLVCINNQEEFNSLFSFMKLIYEKNREGIKTKLNKLSVNQLCSLVQQISFYDIANQDIPLIDIVCKAIAHKYSPVKDLPSVNLLPFELKNIIAKYRVEEVIDYIDWNIQPLHAFETQGYVYAAVLSPDGNNLVTSSWHDNIVRVIDLQTKKELYALTGHTDRISTIVFSPYDANILATGSRDRTIRIWNLKAQQCVKTFVGHTNFINTIAFDSNDPTILVTGSCNGSIKRWNINTEKCIRTFVLDPTWSDSVVFNPKNSNIVATGSNNSPLQIWNVKTKKCLLQFDVTGQFTPMKFSSDGESLLTTSDDNIVRLWNLQTGVCKKFVGHKGAIALAEFMPNNSNILITVSSDQTIKVWDVQKEQCLSTFIHDEHVAAAMVAPDGKSIIAGYYNVKMKVWGIDSAVKDKLLNDLTMEQADLLLEIYTEVLKGLSFNISNFIKSNNRSDIFSTFALGVQKYLLQEFSIEL